MDVPNKIKDVIEVKQVEDKGWKYDVNGTVNALSPKYPTGNISVVKTDTPNIIPRVGDKVVAVFERENLKQNQAGDSTWHYYWKIVEYDVSADSVTTAVSSTVSGKVFNAISDVRTEARYSQHATNVRTALMQAQEYGRDDAGVQTLTDDGIAITADIFLEYLTSRLAQFSSSESKSPMVQNLQDSGAEIVSVEPKSGDAMIQEFEQQPLEYNSSSPANVVTSGVELKMNLEAKGIDVPTAMTYFTQIGIAKSTDYVSSGRGSYDELYHLILKMHTDASEGI
jgi:hypothetical protein